MKLINFIQNILKIFESLDSKIISIVIILFTIFIIFLTQSSFPFSDQNEHNITDFHFYDNLIQYENPYLNQTEYDLRFFHSENYGKQPIITQKIKSENEINYQIQYYSFALDTPNFLDEKSFDLFIQLESERYNQTIDKKEKKIYYNYTQVMEGNISFSQNRKFRKIPECNPVVELSSFKNPFITKPRHFQKLVLGNTRWAEQFQHWIDRCAPVLLQIRPMIKDQGWTIVTTKPRDPIIYKFWEFVKKDFNVSVEFTRNMHSYKVDNLLFPCNLPWDNMRKFPEVKNFLLKSILGNESWESFQDHDPQNIVYMPRVNNYNKRDVLNDQQIRDYLQNRFGDKLKIFTHKNFTDFKDLVRFFSSAKVVIGLHGGAFYNILYSLSHPIIIEFHKKEYFKADASIFWICHTNGYEYWRDYADSYENGFLIPLNRVEQILNAALHENYTSG
ncbi:hypothetical protein M0811_01636 [Anaeramoeba ignava]|uniref:Glycosyltransferase 61 catalytic domain-containing protein n=1 Tax=Anaeramoeba ignava TaxID=1746090 RepID=A0A9Q0LG22_ANAIG|nr:hypothetical protein M0811_01636 [Anaeramoeba ignava]